MDQHYVTREFLENQLVQLTDEVNNLRTFKEDLIKSSNTTHNRLTALQDELKQWTRSELSAEDITVEQAQSLATIGNFTLTTCYDVTVVVEHSFSIELEAGDDVDDVLSTLDFSVDSYHTTLDNTDYSVVESNYDECN
jgi:hypothetical protein